METTSPPADSTHEEVENEHRQPLIAGSPVDDVANNQEQFMDSISTCLITSPENLGDCQQPPPVGDGGLQHENEHRQPLIAGSPVDDVAHNQEQFMDSISPSLLISPGILVDRQQQLPVGDGDVQPESDNRKPEIAGSPLLQVDDVEQNHEQFMESISPSLLPSPENLVDRRQLSPPSEHGEDKHEYPALTSPIPEEKINDGEEPFEPPSTASLPPPSPQPIEVTHPPENLLRNDNFSPEIQPQSPPENQPLTEVTRPPENLSPNREYPPANILSPENQSQSPLQLIEADYPPENISPNHESPISKQPSPQPPPTEAEYQPENLSPSHNSPISKQPPSPSPLPETAYSSKNLSLKHESPLSKPPQSPAQAEGPLESPNYRPKPEPPSSPAQLQENANLSPITKQSPKDLSPSPPPPQDTLEPNTLTPPLGVPLLLHAASTFSPSKPQISPWTHQETANLIQAYQEKWYSLKKGPLKAGQWEEVAITVAARCGYDEPTKTSKQCRHKIEKLRKRYRTERGKPRSKATAWNFFKLMDNLEKGPLPISSSQPMELVEYQKPSTSNVLKRKNDVYNDDGDREFLANNRSSRARNTNHHVANGGLAMNLRFSDGGNRVVRGLRTPVIHKRKEVYQEEREEENNVSVGEEEDVGTQLAAEIKGFAQKFVKMENKKIEMMRDVERYRLEMENKRMKMIIESQQMLVETVNNAFGSSVKTHKLSAS